MKEHPISFKTEMIQAIFAGWKHMTRRTRGLKRINERPAAWGKPVLDPTDGKWVFTAEHGPAEQVRVKCPYGVPGDRLWVRETWAKESFPDGTTARKIITIYKADETYNLHVARWKPSIHMPREACRLLLAVTNIRMERLNDITGRDAIAEGIDMNKTPCIEPQNAFAILWNSINGPLSWSSNPWVWVVGFERING